MPHIEIVPNSTSISAPGWAYVPDNGYDPSKAAIQPTGARKRAARTSGIAGGDTSTRQQNAIAKHLVELDKDNNRDVQIQISTKQKDNTSRVSKNKLTQNVRRILMSQKTFANHLADEEAALALQDHNQNAGSITTARASTHKPAKTSSLQKRSSTSQPPITSISDSQTNTIAQDLKDSGADDPLLKSYIPTAPSEAIMEELLSGPALSYNRARVAPPTSGKPQRRFCEICGYWGTIKCTKCGARVCGLECRKAHADGRCIFYA